LKYLYKYNLSLESTLWDKTNIIVLFSCEKTKIENKMETKYL
jgi:hypothetical protein